MRFQPVHHSLSIVPAKCFTPEEQGMLVCFHVTNATAPSEGTVRDFLACTIFLSFSKSAHALAHLKLTFPNKNDQNTSPILAKNFTLLTRWRYRGGETDSLLTSYVSSASGRNFSEFALRLTKYGNQAEINKTDNRLFTNTANTSGHCK